MKRRGGVFNSVYRELQREFSQHYATIKIDYENALQLLKLTPTNWTVLEFFKEDYADMRSASFLGYRVEPEHCSTVEEAESKIRDSNTPLWERLELWHDYRGELSKCVAQHLCNEVSRHEYYWNAYGRHYRGMRYQDSFQECLKKFRETLKLNYVYLELDKPLNRKLIAIRNKMGEERQRKIRALAKEIQNKEQVLELQKAEIENNAKIKLFVQDIQRNVDKETDLAISYLYRALDVLD